MWEILGYVLFVAVFVSISCATVTWAPTAAAARRRFELLFSIATAIALLLCFLGESTEYTELSRPAIFLLTFSFVLSDLLFIRPLLRRRVIPPCVRAKTFTQGLWLVIIGLLVFFVLVLVAFPLPWGRMSLPVLISQSLCLVSICGLLISKVRPHAEICANGLWYDGALLEWTRFERFAWREEGDKTVVEVLYSRELWSPVSPSARMIVPPENCQAAKKLLEANLVEDASA